MSLWAELKRRKVVRVAVVYAATSFALLEAADLMLPRLGVPDWSMNLIVGLVILGFPIALIMGWALELTPEGVKRTDEMSEPATLQATPALLGKRTVFVAALLVAVGVGLGAGWFLRPAADEAGDAPIVTAAVPPPIEAVPAVAALREAGAAVETDENTIAVLPFVNMSANPENVFFAEGIAEELLNILAGVDGLKVASRTSSFSFRGKDTPIPQIARELGVRHILEGSVRRQGDRVRITAQLIETESDTHLWSETFERDLEDIFRVQEEIAQAITGALKDVLGVRTVRVAAATANLEAYDRFLRGRSRFYQRRELDDAIADFRFAVEQDPGFAEAWAFLSAAGFVVATGGYPTMFDEAALLAAAQEAADRALALDPVLPTALGVKGQLGTRAQTAAQRIEGIRLLERAASLPSADTSARLWLGLALMELGLAERARPHLERAFDQDPLVQINVGYLGVNNLVRGNSAKGQQFIERAVELGGHDFWYRLLLVELVNRGDMAAAEGVLATVDTPVGPAAYDLAAELRDAYADPAQRDAALAVLRARAEESGRWRALLPALMMRDGALAIGLIGNDVDRIVLAMSAWMPSLGWLRESPEFYEYMRSIGSVGFWEAEGYPAGCRPVDDPAGRRLDCSGYGP